jgi:hypothetical protein
MGNEWEDYLGLRPSRKPPAQPPLERKRREDAKAGR